MIVRTEDVHERGNSIGMFSRNGKATALLHSIFRDKNEPKNLKSKLNEDYLEQLMKPTQEK